MAVPANILVAKSKAIIETIASMNAQEKGKSPNLEFCEDFNRIHKMTAEAFPALADALPPKLNIFDSGWGLACNVHLEIEAYCRQIVNLLQAVGESP